MRLQLPLVAFSEEKVTQNRVIATTRVGVMLDSHTAGLLPGNLPWNSKIIRTKQKKETKGRNRRETLTERGLGYTISMKMERR